MTTKKQVQKKEKYKPRPLLGVPSTEEERDLLTRAARLSRQSRNAFVLFHALEAARRVIAVNEAMAASELIDLAK